MPLTIGQIKAILDQNKNKSFVKRIYNPEKYPTLDNGDGTTSTHSMAAEVDAEGNWRVFPTVLTTKNNTLARYPLEKAMEYTNQTGNFISFGKNKDAALDFSQNYKKVWDKK